MDFETDGDGLSVETATYIVRFTKGYDIYVLNKRTGAERCCDWDQCASQALEDFCALKLVEIVEAVDDLGKALLILEC